MDLKTWIVLALFLIVVGYRIWIRRGVENISVHELRQRLDGRESLNIVDVREPRQYEAGHIYGAVNIPLGRLDEVARLFGPDDEIIVMCQTGTRSISAYHRLKKLGFQQVRNLDGGMNRWPWERVKGK